LGSKKNSKPKGSVKSHRLSRSEKIAIPIVIIIAIWVIYSFIQPTSTSTSLQITYSSTGSLTQSGGAPDFTLPAVNAGGLNGQTVTLSSFRGKVVLLEFMEPWCPHCQHMAPVLDSLQAQYGNGSVVFISVAGPWNGATANDAASFIHNYGTSWVYVYDSSGTVFANYRVSATPTFFIIGKNGSVLSTFQGEQTSDTLFAAISAAGIPAFQAEDVRRE
jgi:thiol-disulfide isomerase/thioredoxin